MDGYSYMILGLLVGLLIGWHITQAHFNVQRHALRTKLESKQQQLEEMKLFQTSAHERNIQYEQQLSRLTETNQHLQGRLVEQKEEVIAIQERLTLHFKNLANDLLEEKSKKFTDQNKVHLEGLLKPLGERIHAFEQQVIQTNKESLARNVALRTEVKKLSELNTQITKEADNLARAIKGDTKLQGSWGEFILESILEKSGLTKHREYETQASVVAEDGKRYQPDVIIKLPEERHVIVDAKVSLVNYEQFFNAEQADAKASALKQHVQSIRRHVRTLSEKNYQSHYGIKKLDFVLLFVPIESAFSLAVQHDSALFQDAYERNIVLVSPTTLMATLRTIANIWKHEDQNRNALEIAQQSGALYDKFVGFVEDLKNVGRQLDVTQRTYTEAMKKLYEGRGNLIRRVQHIKTLGANTNKVLDTTLVQRAQEYGE